MKKQLLISVLFLSVFCVSVDVKAQMVYMPDSMLRLKLTNLGYGSCIVGDSIDSTCPLVTNTTSLDVSAYSIRSLEGIHVFTSLNKLLCFFNDSLNLSYLPSSLDTLLCYSSYIQSLPYLPSGLLVLDCSGNLLTSLPNLPNSLKSLGCAANQLTSLPNLPATLTNLYCPNNKLTSLPALPSSLISLYCYTNSLVSLPTLPNSLTTLYCSSNPLHILPTLPPSLETLYCWSDSLSSLPALPATLTSLNCSQNLLTSLPTLPSSLNLLDCGGNQLTSLPSLPQSMTSLRCENNFITSLPVLPSGLIELKSWRNQLTVLPTLPSTLRILYFDFNSITTIPVLPSGLEIFGCQDNPLGTLPSVLPSTLIHFYCSNTGISILPSLPSTLKHLDCSRNLLTTLPALPGSLLTLRCDSNQLTSFPDLPDSIAYLTLKYNYQLTCLPKLTKITTLDFQFCPVTCLPNYGNVNTSYPQLSSLPLCDVFNANGCNFYWNISGKTFFDPDNNCMQAVTEPGLKNMHLELYQNNVLVQQAFTGGEGLYSFDVNTIGNYEVRLDTAFLPFTAVCPLSNNYLDTISAQDSVVYNNDFASRCKFGFDVGAWSIVPSILRPSYLATVRIRAGDIANFYGVRCASGISGALTVTINGNAHYFGPVTGAWSPSNVSGNTITFNIADFDSINSLSDFAFVIETDTNAVSGSQICFDVNVTPITGDNNASNNTLTNCFSVMASFDPNDKQVYPAGITDTSQHWLTYTIRFQNTGTASADNIYILDTLDNDFDLSTFQLLATSHPSYVQILDGGVAKFNFPNINLPDSNANEPLSHGYVQYKVKLKDNLPIGTQIHNTAFIYFDFNAPVVTNTTLNTLDVVNGIIVQGKLPEVNVWPVPFENSFMIQGDYFVKGSHYSIVNLFGNEMVKGQMSDTYLKVATGHWASGIYFLRIETSSGVVVKKVVKK